MARAKDGVIVIEPNGMVHEKYILEDKGSHEKCFTDIFYEIKDSRMDLNELPEFNATNFGWYMAKYDYLSIQIVDDVVKLGNQNLILEYVINILPKLENLTEVQKEKFIDVLNKYHNINENFKYSVDIVGGDKPLTIKADGVSEVDYDTFLQMLNFDELVAHKGK